MRLYAETMDALSAAVRKGAAEDDSRGYALSAEPTLRAKQLATREYAIRHERSMLRVLGVSRDAGQRAVAAHFLGYARQSDAQIAAPVRASRDADETVRNNAVRALDRNKAGFLLDTLSRGRDRKVLGQLRSQAPEALVEMARWRSSGHAYSARLLLGRIAGIEETRLRRLVDAGRVDAIINELPGTR
ncbi:MAG: hypothetical protein M3416_01810 [Acidobacteriota bacterium]|nr:hypothetical protein [Acidobacteriota bacterium]